MKLDLKIIKKKFFKNKVNLITVDGITCSGKTLFSKLIASQIKNSVCISKDLFLLPRLKRIKFTKNLKKKKLLLTKRYSL